MERLFHRRVRDEKARDENLRNESAGDEGDFSDWKRGTGIICGGLWRWEFDFHSYADAHANAAGQLFTCELEWDVRVLDERHG